MKRKHKTVVLNTKEVLEKNLKAKVINGTKIKSKDIKDAEDICFNNKPPLDIIYNEYGFINDDDDEIGKKK